MNKITRHTIEMPEINIEIAFINDVKLVMSIQISFLTTEQQNLRMIALKTILQMNITHT